MNKIQNIDDYSTPSYQTFPKLKCLIESLNNCMRSSVHLSDLGDLK